MVDQKNDAILVCKLDGSGGYGYHPKYGGGWDKNRDVNSEEAMNYSSAIFEANMIHNPGFVYADDLEDYIAERGDF